MLPDYLSKFAEIIKENVPLSTVTYMKVGGPADYLATVTNTADLAQIVIAAKANQLNFLILGGGTNTIFSDKGYRGLIVVNKTNQVSFDENKYTVKVDSGVPMNLLVNEACKRGFGGLEAFLGIPGTVGGAVYNNSHYLTELIGDHVLSVLILNQDNQVVTKPKSYFKFKYDYSILHETQETILSVNLKLFHQDPFVLIRDSRTALMRRKETQPLSMPSSGCMFQNFKDQVKTNPKIPEGITSAGALIDKMGLKNTQVGGAKISDIHANFIVNANNATVDDIITLSNQVISEAKNRYDINLKREVFILDEFGNRIDKN